MNEIVANQSDVTKWEKDNQSNIIRWDADYTNPDYKIIVFTFCDNSEHKFKISTK